MKLINRSIKIASSIDWTSFGFTKLVTTDGIASLMNKFHPEYAGIGERACKIVIGNLQDISSDSICILLEDLEFYLKLRKGS